MFWSHQSIFAGVRNDLFQFDPAALTWRQLAATPSSKRPPARQDAGFDASEDALYLFGGLNASGIITNLKQMMFTRESRQIPDL